MRERCRILLISGSLRSRSSNSALLRTAVAAAPSGVEAAVVRSPVSRDAVGPDGLIADPQIRDAAVTALHALAARVATRAPA